MKLLVYGAGVTGSRFAARLHEAGHDVSLLARERERLAASAAKHRRAARRGRQLRPSGGCRWLLVEHPAGMGTT